MDKTSLPGKNAERCDNLIDSIANDCTGRRMEDLDGFGADETMTDSGWVNNYTRALQKEAELCTFTLKTAQYLWVFKADFKQPRGDSSKKIVMLPNNSTLLCVSLSLSIPILMH